MDFQPNNPDLSSWLDYGTNTGFSIQNIPFGVYSVNKTQGIPCTRISDSVIDLQKLGKSGLLKLSGIPQEAFAQPNLNQLFSLGRKKVGELRNRIGQLFDSKNPELESQRIQLESCIIHFEAVEMVMPVNIPNYTDFYSSKEHATNVGKMFRDPENALLPNWKHIPVGYHGRASSIVVSGTPINRPMGQMKPDPDAGPVFGPTRLLDFELEMAFITCRENGLGNPIPIEETDDFIIGMALFNDWSARDIQKWEYIPLGPFLAKNFGSSISPWIVTLDALEPFRVAGPKQDPEVLNYLKSDGKRNIDINLETFIQPENGESKRVNKSNFKYMYWNMNQQLAHHTVNGCNIEIGDLYASGTISGHTPDSYGSMLELTWRGSNPIQMPDGSERKFINDGDTVIMTGHCENDKVKISFGEVRTKILPAKSLS